MPSWTTHQLRSQLRPWSASILTWPSHILAPGQLRTFYDRGFRIYSPGGCHHHGAHLGQLGVIIPRIKPSWPGWSQDLLRHGLKVGHRGHGWSHHLCLQEICAGWRVSCANPDDHTCSKWWQGWHDLWHDLWHRCKQSCYHLDDETWIGFDTGKGAKEQMQHPSIN